MERNYERSKLRSPTQRDAASSSSGEWQTPSYGDTGIETVRNRKATDIAVLSKETALLVRSMRADYGHMGKFKIEQ